MLFIIQRLIKLSAAPAFNLIKKDRSALETRLILLDKPLRRCFPGLSIPGTAGWLGDDTGTWDLTGNGMNVEAGRGANVRDCGNLSRRLVWKLSLRKKPQHYQTDGNTFCASVFFPPLPKIGRTMTPTTRRQQSDKRALLKVHFPRQKPFKLKKNM